MGTWHLEVAKMAMYMIFPVGLFYFINTPEYFEKQVNKRRREIMPKPNIEAIDRFKAAVERAQRKKEEKWEEELAKVAKN